MVAVAVATIQHSTEVMAVVVVVLLLAAQLEQRRKEILAVQVVLDLQVA